MFFTLMLLALGMMYSSDLGLVSNGKFDLTATDFEQNESVELDGQWEFYWNKLLEPKDFTAQQPPKIDSFIKVPGSWNDKGSSNKVYPNHGVATYRLLLKYPAAILDPALSIKTVSAAYRLYADGKLVTEIGRVSEKKSDYRGDYRQIIVELPKDKQELELLFQVANHDYIRGGLRDSLTFGSCKVLTQQKVLLFSIQLIFIGIVISFGIYCSLIFILDRKNITSLLFSILCYITALNASVWGETPLLVLIPQLKIQHGILINYFVMYNLMPIVIAFVISLYPSDYKKNILRLVLLPTLFFEVLLLAPAGLRASLNDYFYMVILMQMIYILFILIKVVLRKRENAELLLVAIGIFIVTILADQMHYRGVASINVSYMFLYGNFAVIIVMSYIQARRQANTHQRLVQYNAKLIEADRLKDKVMETEMSFLQAQIKPHFLYNALNAIANVCERKEEKGGKLILDLAIYLRNSLEFNNLDKMAKVEKELEFADTYFNIEQARFGEKIQLLKEIEISLDEQIPVLLLQPLVENAVRHGISKKTNGGTVWVRMKYTYEGISIEIEDNGVGIKDEKLTVLLNGDAKEQGVGLINIHNRLLILYGTGLNIKSQVGHGTCVSLMIPGGRGKL